MRARSLFVIAVAALLAFAFCPETLRAQTAEKTRVVVIPLPSESTIPQLATVRATVADTITLTLQLTGDFSVSQAPDDRWSSAEEYLAVTELGTVDRIVTVEAQFTDGEYRIAAAVVNPVSGDVETQRSESVRSVLFLFDTVDLLVPDLLETMVGRRVTFGSLQVRVSGWDVAQIESLTMGGRPLLSLLPDAALETVPPVEGQVLVDGVPVGTIGTAADRILTGDHRVRVEQDRAGSVVPIAEERVSIDANERHDLFVSVPLATKEEADALQAAFEELDGLVERAGVAPIEREEIQAVFAAAANTVDALAVVAPPLAELQPALTDLELWTRVVALESQLKREWREPPTTVLRELTELRRLVTVGTGAVSSETTDGLVTSEQPGAVSSGRNLPSDQRPFSNRAVARLADLQRAFPQLWSLGLTSRLESQSLAGIRTSYRNLETELARFDLETPEWVATDLAVLDAIDRERQSGRQERPGLYQLLGFGGAGAGLAGLGGLVGSYLVHQQLTELRNEYDDTTDVARAGELHDQIQSQTALFNGLVYGGAGAVGLGAGAIVAGQVARNQDVKRPDRLQEQRVQTYFADRATLAEQFERALAQGEASVPVAGFETALSSAPEGLVMVEPGEGEAGPEVAQPEEAPLGDEPTPPGTAGATIPDGSILAASGGPGAYLDPRSFPTVSWYATAAQTFGNTNEMFLEDTALAAEDGAWFGGIGVGLGISTRGLIPATVRFGAGLAVLNPRFNLQIYRRTLGQDLDVVAVRPFVDFQALAGNPWRKLAAGIQFTNAGNQMAFGLMGQFRNLQLGYIFDTSTYGDGVALGYHRPLGGAGEQSGETVAGSERATSAAQGATDMGKEGAIDHGMEKNVARFLFGRGVGAVPTSLRVGYGYGPTTTLLGGDAASMTSLVREALDLPEEGFDTLIENWEPPQLKLIRYFAEIQAQVSDRSSIGLGIAFGDRGVYPEWEDDEGWTIPGPDGVTPIDVSLYLGEPWIVMSSFEYELFKRMRIRSEIGVGQYGIELWRALGGGDDNTVRFTSHAVGSLYLGTGLSYRLLHLGGYGLDVTGLVNLEIADTQTFFRTPVVHWRPEVSVSVVAPQNNNLARSVYNRIQTRRAEDASDPIGSQTGAVDGSGGADGSGEAAAQEDAAADTTLVTYPWGALAATTVLTPSQDYGIISETYTIGGGLFSGTRLPLGVTFGIGVGRVAGFREGGPLLDEWNGMVATGQLRPGFVTSFEMGNRWRRAALGIISYVDGAINETAPYLAFRNLALSYFPYDSDKAVLIEYATPLGSKPRQARQIEREHSETNRIPTAEVRLFTSILGNYSPDDDYYNIGSNYFIRVENNIAVDAGIELTRRLGNRYHLGIGFLFPLGPLGLGTIGSHTVSADSDEGTILLVTEVEPNVGGYLVHRLRFSDRIGLLSRTGVKFMSQNSHGGTDSEDYHIPLETTYYEFWVDVGVNVGLWSGSRLAAELEFGPHLSISDFSGYWDLDTRVLKYGVFGRLNYEIPNSYSTGEADD